MKQALGRSVKPGNLVAEVLRSKKIWFTVSFAIVKIRQELMKEERTRRADRSRRANA